MKCTIILTAALALPGGSFSQPVTELTHSAQAAANSAVHSTANTASHSSSNAATTAARSSINTAIHSFPGPAHITTGPEERAPGFFQRLFMGAEKYAQRMAEINLKDQGVVVKSIPIYADISLPFNQEEKDLWSRSVAESVKARLLVKYYFPQLHEAMNDYDKPNYEMMINYLARYVEERRRVGEGRVSKKIDVEARMALLQLLTIEHYRNWLFYPNKWQLPHEAVVRLKMRIESQEAEALTRA